MEKQLKNVTIVFLLFVLFGTLCPKLSQGADPISPKETYLHFRELIETEQYDKAYALLDSNARSEFRLVSRTVLGMAGIPTSKLEQISDFDMFIIFMSHRNPHKYKFVSEEIDKDMATVYGQILQGSSIHPAKTTLKKISGRWFIHSSDVSFGE